MKNYYKVLDLDKNSSSQKIKSQVKKKIKSLRESKISTSEKEKILLQYEDAYNFLKDYHNRRKLDEYLEMNSSISLFDNRDLFSNSLITKFDDILDTPFFLNKFNLDDKNIQNNSSFYSYSSSSTTKNKDGNIIIDKYESTNNNGEKKESHKIITKDQKGNEIIKDVPIKKKNNKFKYNI